RSAGSPRGSARRPTTATPGRRARQAPKVSRSNRLGDCTATRTATRACIATIAARGSVISAPSSLLFGSGVYGYHATNAGKSPFRLLAASAPNGTGAGGRKRHRRGRQAWKRCVLIRKLNAAAAESVIPRAA